MYALATRLTASSCLLNRLHCRLCKDTRVSYNKGPHVKKIWPEPITQPTLEQFLQDINYFDEPRKFINIGLTIDPDKRNKVLLEKPPTPIEPLSLLDVSESQVDDLLGALGEEAELPELDTDDTLINSEQLANLALMHGIYRDLFDRHIPTSEYISFTQEQAQRLDRLIPPYWITDLPHSRVSRFKEEPRPLYYFEPMIKLVPRFINGNPQNESEGGQYAHTSYHGNIISASEALVKPSITLDGQWLSNKSVSSNLVQLSQIANWEQGNISCCNFDTPQSEHYYSIILLNMDSLHPDVANLHWFVANVSLSISTAGLSYEEMCDYLPVHGIRGFGHSRYVFLALRHDSKLDVEHLKINNYSLDSRKFDTKSFLDQHKDKNMVPVGVSWFQTVWDESSNKVFHDYLKMKAPVYEAIQPKYEKPDIYSKAYPGRIPFNIFLDHCRDTKDINKQVLTERLSTIDPYEYKDQYVPPKVPPTVFADGEVPSWMKMVLLKKRNRVGYWRGLRPASATIPLNNNADLDYPIRPLQSVKKHPPGFHNKYQGKPVKKLLKDLPYNKQLNEHRSVFIQEDHEIHLDKVREMMNDFEMKNSGEEAKKS